MPLVRAWLVLLLVACQPAIEPGYVTYGPVPAAARFGPQGGKLDDRRIDFAFDGGQLEFELYRDGTQITQVVRNRYAVAVTIHWTIGALVNAEPVATILAPLT